MVVGVDEAWNDHMARHVMHFIRRGGKGVRGTNRLDDAVAREEAAAPDFAPLAVHRDENVGILEEERGQGTCPL